METYTKAPAADQAQEITPAAIIAAYNLNPDKAEALRCLLAPKSAGELQNLWRARVAIDHDIAAAERTLLAPVRKNCSSCSNCSASVSKCLASAEGNAANAEQLLRYDELTKAPVKQELTKAVYITAKATEARKLKAFADSVERGKKRAYTPPVGWDKPEPAIDPKRFDKRGDRLPDEVYYAERPYLQDKPLNQAGSAIAAKVVLIAAALAAGLYALAVWLR